MVYNILASHFDKGLTNSFVRNCGKLWYEVQILIMFKRLVSAYLFYFPERALHKEF